MKIYTNDEDSFMMAFTSIIDFLNEARPEYECSLLERAKLIEKNDKSTRVKKKFDKVSNLIEDKVIKDNCFIT